MTSPFYAQIIKKCVHILQCLANMHTFWFAIYIVAFAD
ncbi:putative membrane protein [Moraxella catarrhalis]|uniref:Membrane protein n=1 Tax=Moraxella catarrhalis TaxID=480 RepID=A0ABY0BIR8_MORCA|nr:putative membrane protein [Moraxella catarrhalis]RUO13467.1 putative membrane protein [Moraxella catarrhalis]RUO15233.1 putative membrane protein [Moraxella catarrhalis]